MRARLQPKVLPGRGLHILNFDINIYYAVITLRVIYMGEDVKFLTRFNVSVCQFKCVSVSSKVDGVPFKPFSVDMLFKQHHVKLPFLGGPDGLDGEREPGGEEPVARALHGEEVDPGRGGHPQVRDERDEVVRDRDGLAPGQNGKWLSMHTQYDKCGTENMGH